MIRLKLRTRGERKLIKRVRQRIERQRPELVPIELVAIDNLAEERRELDLPPSMTPLPMLVRHPPNARSAADRAEPGAA